MSRMDPAHVLVDASALAALADPAHEHHHQTVRAFDDLLERYRREEVLLVAVGSHLRHFELGPSDGSAAAIWARVRWFVKRPHRGRFAPIDPIHVGRQHRRLAARMHTHPHDPEFALTLVLCQRHRVQSVLALDPRFASYDINLIALG
jgi:predicted nucleic acid-binding protein